MPDLSDPFFDIDSHIDKVGNFDLILSRKWDCVPLTRSYIEDYLSLNMFNRSDISRIEMTASELLENCVKYSSREGIRIIMKIGSGRKHVDIHAFNYTKPELARTVRDRIKEMNEEEPLKYYLHRIRLSRQYKKEFNSGGIGLSRIYYEGKAKVDTDYNKDKELLLISATIFCTQ